MGEFPFYVGVKQFNSSFYDLSPERTGVHRDNVHSHQVVVSTVTLDHFFREHKEVDPNDYDLLYLDVQGSELSVLRGAEHTLAKITLINHRGQLRRNLSQGSPV